MENANDQNFHNFVRGLDIGLYSNEFSISKSIAYKVLNENEQNGIMIIITENKKWN